MHHRAPERPRASAVRTALIAATRQRRLTERALIASLVVLLAAAVAVVLTGATPAGPLTLAAQTTAPRHGLAAQQRADGHGAPAPQAADPDAEERGQDGGDHRREQPPAAVGPNPNCSLAVPADPTSATGLTTPYLLSATNPGAGECHETDVDQSAFVEAAIFDPATRQISIYHPLVIDEGSRPAAAPVPVTLPANATVSIWFGFNGDTLTLTGAGTGQCVNGVPGSPFGQFAYCNAPSFFAAVNQAIKDGTLKVPSLGNGHDGLPCPTTRDFSVVDQDQSDNLATTYRVIDGRVAQDTSATAQGTLLSNGSDEGLLATSIDRALGCQPWTAPDLTDGNRPTPALALNELSAAANQAAPAALVPTSDPMVQVDGETSTTKTNLYRLGVDMPGLPDGQTSREYCTHLRTIAPNRLAADAAFFRQAPSPTPGSADLLMFLRARYQGTLAMLNCPSTTDGANHDGSTAGAPSRNAPNPAVPAPSGG